MLDAAEIPPTFGTPAELVRAHVAGGREALVRAVEGAEDDGEAGAALMQEALRAGDAVIGISAAGGAAFVVHAIARARATSARTPWRSPAVADSPLARAADTAIVVATGAEALAGSTRMKAGTAQKIALNAISTAVMVRLERIYDNLMVDLVASNHKLRRRALRLICTIAEVPRRARFRTADAAGGSVKIAVVMHRRDVGAECARALLESSRRLAASPLVVPFLAALLATIAFVPIDDRPVTAQFPVLLGRVAGVAVHAPAPALLGRFLRPGSSDARAIWSNREARTAGRATSSSPPTCWLTAD